MTWFDETVMIEFMTGPFTGTVTEAPGRAGGPLLTYWVRQGEGGALEIRSGDLGHGPGEGWRKHAALQRWLYRRGPADPIPIELWED